MIEGKQLNKLKKKKKLRKLKLAVKKNFWKAGGSKVVQRGLLKTELPRMY